jgi:hypothetical protein
MEPLVSIRKTKVVGGRVFATSFFGRSFNITNSFCSEESAGKNSR